MDPQKTDRGAPTRAIGLAKCVVDADQASASPTIDELNPGGAEPRKARIHLTMCQLKHMSAVGLPIAEIPLDCD